MLLKNKARNIVIAGTLLIWLVKFVIRPFATVPNFISAFLGIAPNLIGSFLLPFGACWLFQKYFRFKTLKDVQLSCYTGLFLVVLNEYLQLIPYFGRTFDYFDIAFSFVGVGIGYFAFALIMPKNILAKDNFVDGLIN